MLRIYEQKSAETIRRYFASQRFYDQRLGLVGDWGGLGTQRLGLHGRVVKTDLEKLCDNIHPATGGKLTVRSVSNRTVAYAFRFSLSKSVSILYGIYQDPGILDAFRMAISQTMQEMETEMKTRLRKGAQDGERITGNMVWAEFLHTVASPVDGECDPQLQAYLPVFNATWDGVEERWKAGWFQDLKRDAPYFEAVFRARAANLIESLGYRVRRKGKDFEIDGVPALIIKRFSRRTDVVERKVLELKVTDPEVKMRIGPITREGSVPAFWTRDLLRREWTRRLSSDEQKLLDAVYLGRSPPSGINDRLLMIVDETLRSMTGAGTVPERLLLTKMLIDGMGEITVEALRQELDERRAIRIGDGRQRALLL